VVTHKTEEELRHRGIRVPITYLPIYVDTDYFARVDRKPHPRGVVAFLGVGRFESEKQFTKAIDALVLARSHGHDAELTLVGNGSQEELLRTYAREVGMADHVHFEGYQGDIRPYLETAAALLVPSRYEGYGMVIVEALAARVPVIATPVGIAEEAGAMVVQETAFAQGVLTWLDEGEREGVLRGYPYSSQEEYVRAWVEDVRAAANKAA
jgi:glycosyltransferase involved in cell wall biosynthesis